MGLRNVKVLHVLVTAGIFDQSMVSQTTVLHMKRLNQTESPIFVILCVLCFQRLFFLTLILILHALVSLHLIA